MVSSQIVDSCLNLISIKSFVWQPVLAISNVIADKAVIQIVYIVTTGLPKAYEVLWGFKLKGVGLIFAIGSFKSLMFEVVPIAYRLASHHSLFIVSPPAPIPEPVSQWLMCDASDNEIGTKTRCNNEQTNEWTYQQTKKQTKG